MNYKCEVISGKIKIQGYSKGSINFQKFILQVLLGIWLDWRENSQSYVHTLQALDVNPTCDVTYVKSIIQLFPHSSQHVTGNSSHSLSDAPLQITDIRTLRDFLSIRTQDIDLASVVFVKFLKVYTFLNNCIICISQNYAQKCITKFYK
jgi:hypothetical protein